mgnify:CR=1 FL=1
MIITFIFVTDVIFSMIFEIWENWKNRKRLKTQEQRRKIQENVEKTWQGPWSVEDRS